MATTYRPNMSAKSEIVDMSFDPARPFNDLPPLPPAAGVETQRVLKACIEARVALEALKQIGRLIPNQSILINSIPILEAQASSEIENIVTTTDKLFRYANEPEDGADPATKEALRYRTALHNGFHMLRDRPVSTRMAVEIVRTIKNVELDVRATPGTALVNDRTGDTIYTPPEGADLLRSMLGNWERYINEEVSIDPLVRMAVMHYQFEAIHPFADGNGRTGRVLNILFLVEQGLLEIPVLYLSRHIIKHKSDYYTLLLEVTRDGRWEEWILFMLEAVASTARSTTEKIEGIRKLMDDTASVVRDKAAGVYSRELIEAVFAQPYCRIGNLVDVGIAKRQAASAHLKALVKIGVLREIKAGREKLFINPSLVRLLADMKPGQKSIFF